MPDGTSSGRRSGKSSTTKRSAAGRKTPTTKVSTARRATTRSPSTTTENALDLFGIGPAVDTKGSFKEDFRDLATFSKTTLAHVLAPLESRSTSWLALARLPLVLVRVTDNVGIPVTGLQLELFNEEGEFLDSVPSDSIGLGLLRWPIHPPSDEWPALKGQVRAGGTQIVEIEIPPDEELVVVPISWAGATPSSEGVEGSRHDSVLPRLPTFFRIGTADEILRHRQTADGPDPCFEAAVQRQCTYRAPLVRWIYARRTLYPDNGAPRRLYVRIRQEWHYVGHSFGQPELIDFRDVASIAGSVDANVDARLAVQGQLGISTQSVFDADARALLRARASLDGELDASAGLHLFEGGIGNPLSVSGDAALSIDTSLLVSAQLKLRASLRNQLHARASLSGRANLGLQADASVGVNPSLSRELNLPRFVIHQNYVVSSHVEDVQEIQEVELFDDLSEENLRPSIRIPFFPFSTDPSPLFPPADIVEYRPIFERRLLEPLLAGRFRVLRNALDTAAGRGPLIRKVTVDITYSATANGSLQARILGHNASVTLRSGQSFVRMTVNLSRGEFLDDLNGENIQLYLTLFTSTISGGGFSGVGASSPEASIAGVSGTVRVQHVHLSTNASSRKQSASFEAGPPFEATGAAVTASREIAMDLHSTDADLIEDPLVIHINRNPTYYLGLLVRAALANPSLRFDIPQLRRIGPDNLVWKLPIHGFAGNKALVLAPASRDDEEVTALLEDMGRATVVQLAVDGNWSEAMQGKNAIADLAGMLMPGIENLSLPLEMLDGLREGAGLIPSIVDAAGEAADLGSSAGAVPTVTDAVSTILGDSLDL